MITSRDRVIRTLNHEAVDRVPRDLWASHATRLLRGDELAEMSFRYPNDIVRPEFRYPRGNRARGAVSRVGEYTDAWGCTWQVTRRGTTGQLKASPLSDLSQLAAYQPPLEILQRANLARVNRSCATTSRFVLAWSDIRPFERMQFLHGPQATLVDLTGGSRPIRDLLAMLHDFFCRELRMWASTDVDGVVFMDDWGSQDGLLLSAEIWRDLFKPLYRLYCQILHEGDKFAFFLCRGNISEIFGDLVEIGIDAVHSQLFLMDIERLAERFRGRITFWGEIDTRRVLPFGTPDDVRAAVRRVRRALDCGRGGVIAQCEWGHEMAFENIAAVFEQWLEPVLAHA